MSKIWSKFKQILGKLLVRQSIFQLLQSMGLHLSRNHFYSPIPDTSLLKRHPELWQHRSELKGVDLNSSGQISLLNTIFTQYRLECNFPRVSTKNPTEYYSDNGSFGFSSAAVLHCLIRHHAPQTIIEVGAGQSSLVIARAQRLNQTEKRGGKYLSIEPYPRHYIQAELPGRTELITSKLEDVSIELFRQLKAGDILFIDSSHVVKIGGDVNYIFHEILPELTPGVLIHFHDIFFPYEYPRHWVLNELRFWSEQYLLQSFLAFNNAFEVLWCGSYIYADHLSELRSCFQIEKNSGLKELSERDFFSSSFWIQRVK